MDNKNTIKTKEMVEKVNCSYCDELISKNAKKCKHCGEIIDVGMRELNSLKTQIMTSKSRVIVNSNNNNNNNNNGEDSKRSLGSVLKFLLAFFILTSALIMASSGLFEPFASFLIIITASFIIYILYKKKKIKNSV